MDSNVILVFDREKKKLLMCRRRKPPYQGLLNLVGGKVEPGEGREYEAYRELWEETASTREDITLDNIVNFIYPHKFDGAQEYILLLLRLTEGVVWTTLAARFPGYDARALHEKARRIPDGLVVSDMRGLRLTPQGFLVSNAVIAQLLL